MANQITVNGEFVDLYEILEVSPFATRGEIRQAVIRKANELSNPDSDLSLSDRARIHQLVKIASDTVVKSFESRVKYDIGRMMVRGELVLDRIPAPSPDYPSALVAKIRFQMVRRTLGKTLNALVSAYDDAMDERFMQETMRGGLSEDLKEALHQMRVFCAHVTLDMRKATRGTRTIFEMGDAAWDQGIRDPRVDGETGEPTLARRTLGELQVLEEQIRRRFPVQIARALLTVDPGARPRNGPGHGERLLAILRYLRH